MTVHFHEEDLPAGVLAPGPVAVDTETMGLITPRDRLCVVQISDGKGSDLNCPFFHNIFFVKYQVQRIRCIQINICCPVSYHLT